MAWLRNQAGDWRLSARALFRLEAALLGVAYFSASAVPRLLPILLGLLGLVAAIHVFTTDRSPLFKFLRTPFSIGLFLFLGYVSINAMWSPDRVAALLKAATVLGLAAATFLIAASYSLRSESEARVLAKSALAGLMLGIAFLLIEISFGEPIARFLNNHVIQLFNSSPKKTKVVNGEVTEIAAFVLNRNVTSLVLLLMAGLLFTATLVTTTARRVSLVALVGATAIAVLISQSGTSVVAFLLGGFVLALAALSLAATRNLLMVGWTVATLLAVPLGALPYELGWHHWTWLPPESVAARFYIWKYVADRVPEHPIGGIGVRGTRALHIVIPRRRRSEPRRMRVAGTRGAPSSQHLSSDMVRAWRDRRRIAARSRACRALADPIVAAQSRGKRVYAVRCLQHDRAIGIRPLADMASCRSRVRLGRHSASDTASRPVFLSPSSRRRAVAPVLPDTRA